MSETLMTTDELATAIDVHPESIRRWARDGQLPFSRRIGSGTNGPMYFDYDEVREILLRNYLADVEMKVGSDKRLPVEDRIEALKLAQMLRDGTLSATDVFT